MESTNIKSRIKPIYTSKNSGKCVLYVMSRDQRVQDNHALLCAQKHALAKNIPLAVVFCLQEKTGVRSREHYQFMLDGLKQVEKDLKVLSIPFIVLTGPSIERLTGLFLDTDPTAVYFDFSPLKGPKSLIEHFSRSDDAKSQSSHILPSMYVVDTHNVVPVWITSDKQEVGARTIRIKIHKKLEDYLMEPENIVKHPVKWLGEVESMVDLNDTISEIFMGISPSGIDIKFESGEKAAQVALELFVSKKLESYGAGRNDPSNDGQSGLSCYLHFGQLSTLRVALRLREESLKNGYDLHLLSSSKMPNPELIQNIKQYSIDALVEEMIARKELADNFCYYSDNYDTLLSAPGWAIRSLEKHRDDPREIVYSLQELETAKTHDQAWNAAQIQMTRTGKMHGYMRMYWAKKVLEWTESPEQAIEFLIYLNDHYSIDGGDPNGYAGVMWSVAGLHDRPWGERDIFGVVRYMNFAGLKRKFDIETYIQQWQ